MKVNLTWEQEKIIRDKIKSGEFQSAEDVISEALQALTEKKHTSGEVRSNGEQMDAVRDMISFAEKNRVRLQGISIKELLHEGHRL